jgi:hypothetical protein
LVEREGEEGKEVTAGGAPRGGGPAGAKLANFTYSDFGS